MNSPECDKTLSYTKLLPSRWGWVVGLSCDPCITGAIANFGEYCPVETEILTSLIGPGDTAIDVGANIGAVSLALANVVGNTGKVIAIEPQRICFMCLCANTALNSWIHVIQPRWAAVGAESGVVQIPLANVLSDNVNVGGFSLCDDYNRGGEPVELITIDSLNAQNVRLIKADVEGMEAAVLRGAEKTIREQKPALWCEQLDFRAGTKEALQTILGEFGYRAWKIHTKAFIAHNARRRNSNHLGTIVSDPNVLALPRDVEPPPWVQHESVQIFLE